MSNPTISLSRSTKEIFQDIKSSVKKFFDSDEVIKMYQDHLDSIIAEVKTEYLAANIPLVDDSEIEKNKDLFLKYHLADGSLAFIKAHASSFDYFMSNSKGLPSEKIEELMSKCLEQEHMMKYLKKFFKDTSLRDELKEIFKGLLKKR